MQIDPKKKYRTRDGRKMNVGTSITMFPSEFGSDEEEDDA